MSTLAENGVMEMLGIICAISDDEAAGKAIDQCGTVDHLAAMAGACNQPGRIAERIGDDMQLGGQATPGAAKALGIRPPFLVGAPAAC